MTRFIKKSIVFPIIILCAICVVNSSSGLSQFQTKKGVQMKIVDSKDAFISLPKVIDMDIKVIKQIINYYKLSTIFISEKYDSSLVDEQGDDLAGSGNQLATMESSSETETFSSNEDTGVTGKTESSGGGEKKVAVEIKELVGTEERVDIKGNKCEITIKNNMCSDIRLEKIEFDDPYLQSDRDELFLGVGDKCVVTITYNNPGIIDGDEGVEKFESKATLYFSWDKGKSTIYEDVIINITIINEEPENILI